MLNNWKKFAEQYPKLNLFDITVLIIPLPNLCPFTFIGLQLMHICSCNVFQGITQYNYADISLLDMFWSKIMWNVFQTKAATSITRYALCRIHLTSSFGNVPCFLAFKLEWFVIFVSFLFVSCQSHSPFFMPISVRIIPLVRSARRLWKENYVLKPSPYKFRLSSFRSIEFVFLLSTIHVNVKRNF